MHSETKVEHAIQMGNISAFELSRDTTLSRPNDPRVNLSDKDSMLFKTAYLAIRICL